MGATGFAIAIDPVDTRIVYAGTREDGIYRSTDGGETSSQFNQGAVNSDVSGLGGGDVMALAIDSTTRTVYAGTTGNGVSDYQPKG